MIEGSKDKEILEAIRTGNNTAVLHHLYKTAMPKIIRFITQNNGDEEEAKDIFQDAVLALFHTVKLNKYDAAKSLDGFLYFVARNLWVNRIKKRNKQFRIVDTEVLGASENPLAMIITEEKQVAMEELIEKIGSQCKELLKYTLHDKLSMKEVAEKMGFAGETVAKTTHYRCKQKLVALIQANKGLIALLRG
jgi:RNA polymerase sigma factor (sigma-70 family)